MNTPLISICIPIYGVEKYIDRCAHSLFEQTYSNLEFVFVDDCSPDNSIAILKQVIGEYSNRKDQIKILHHDHNRGLAAVRDTAVAAAQGDFIMHVDSDDWIEPNMVELLVRKQQETDADIVSCNALAHYPDHIGTLIEPDYQDKDVMLHQIIQLTLDHVLWRRLIRRSLYEENHIRCVEGVNIGEDHYTLPRLVYYAKSFAKVDAALYHYNCTNQGSYMRTNSTNQLNINKYCNDRDSCFILMDFFKTRETSCVRQLHEILHEYQERMLNGALRCGDWNAYKLISIDLHQPALKYMMLRPYTILCKIIRKCFGISLGPLNYK